MLHTTWRRILALLVALMGLVNILSALFVHVAERAAFLHALLPFELSSGARHATLLAGAGLCVLAYGLWRGKRVAWRLTLGLLAASALVHLLKGLDWEEAISALTLGLALIWQRDAFLARTDPPTLRRALLTLPAGTLALALYALIGFVVFRHTLSPFDVGLATQELLARLTFDSGPYTALAHGRAAWFLDSLSYAGLALAIWWAWALLRPVLARPAQTQELARAQATVEQYASSGLAPFALEPDKSLFFSPSGEGVVAYRVAGGVAVVLGDPIAPTERIGTVALEFASFCREQDWLLCFYQAAAEHLPSYAPLRLQRVKIGEEAWVDVQKFTLQGKAIADIRHAVSKIGRDGLQFHLFDPAHDEAFWLQMQWLEANWREQQGGVELGFSIGHLPHQPAPGARYALALTPDRSEVLAYCAFLPIGASADLALDVLRRGPQAPNGTMEWLLAQALLAFKEQGITWCSLGMAPLANVSDDDQVRLIDRGVRFIYEHPRANQLYRYKSLFFFKKKFNPQWRSGYLLYPGTASLPQVLRGVLQVHIPSLGWRMALAALAEQGQNALRRLQRGAGTQVPREQAA